MRPAARPCVVLGCGRSGTSLLAGTLATSGYDLGDGLLRPDRANPKGFYESRRVNDLNEGLLAPLTSEVLRSADGRPLADRALRQGERWLAALPADVDVPKQPALQEELVSALAVQPGACLARKDPRFTWTLPAWPQVLSDSAVLCVVRHPLAAARSILAMTGQGDLGLTEEGAVTVWAAFYRRALHLSEKADTPWLFVHFDQLLDGTAYARLSDLLGTQVSPAFLDPALRRTSQEGDLPPAVAELHEHLRALAGC